MNQVINAFWHSQEKNTPHLGSHPNVLKIGNLLQRLSQLTTLECNVPTLVAVGSQSSGKSSVINGLLSMDLLPTGKNMVTRTPLRLELVQTNDRPRIEFGEYESLEWKQDVTIDLDIPLPTDEQASKVLVEIKHRTVRLAGSDHNICCKEIVARLFSPLVPSLTIIDLIGLVALAKTDRNQPVDIKQQIEAMIERYVRSPNTIIVAVMPARTDLEADGSLALIKQWDKDGTRTVGVLTKPDLMESGSHVGTYLNGSCSSDLKLHYGYFLVKNRSSSQTITILEGFKQETKYFESHPVYRSVSTERLGMRSLSFALSDILMTKLSEAIPKALTKLRTFKLETQTALDDIGVKPPEDPTSIVHDRLLSFVHGFNDSLESRFAPVNTGRVLRTIFQHFRSDLRELNPFNVTTFPDHDIIEMIYNCQGNHMSNPTPPIEVLEKCLQDRKRDPFQLMTPIAQKCVNNVTFGLNKLCSNLADGKSFSQFPALRNFLVDQTQELINRVSINVHQQVLTTILIESNYIWTENLKFRSDLKAAVSEQVTTVMRQLLNSYYRCAIEAVEHWIPKVIMFFYIKQIQNNLSKTLFSALKKEEIAKLGEEREDHVRRRAELIDRLRCINEVLDTVNHEKSLTH